MYLPVPVSEPVVCSSHIAFEGILGLFPELCSDWMLLAASGLMHDGSHVVDSSPHWSVVTSEMPRNLRKLNCLLSFSVNFL